MTKTVRGTKVFAVLSLIFASYSAANAQTDSAYILRAGMRIQLEMLDSIGSSRVAAWGDTRGTSGSTEPCDTRRDATFLWVALRRRADRQRADVADQVADARGT